VVVGKVLRSMKTLDYFSLFGLPQSFNQEEAEIKSRYYQLQKHVHPDNFIQASEQEKQLALFQATRVNEAYQTLKNPLKRAIYLLKLSGIDVQNETNVVLPQEILTEQFELRERMDELSKEEIERRFLMKQKEVAKSLDSDPIQLKKARLGVYEMQFYAKLLEELSACL